MTCRFIKGEFRLLSVTRPLVPPWDLAVVLQGLKDPPFEPSGKADLKQVSLNTVLFPVLALAKRVNYIHALLAHLSCSIFSMQMLR